MHSILEMVCMQRHHPTTCKARVRQVKLKTYPSMVLMPSLYKIGYGSAAAPFCYHPPARDKELGLSSGWAHKIVGDIVTLFGHRRLASTQKVGEETFM